MCNCVLTNYCIMNSELGGCIIGGYGISIKKLGGEGRHNQNGPCYGVRVNFCKIDRRNLHVLNSDDKLQGI